MAKLVGDQVANGLSGQMANKLVADAVIRKAVAEGDITILDVLDEVPSGSGTVGSIGYVKNAVADARDQIATKQIHEAKIENLKMQEQRKVAIDGLRSVGNDKIFKDPWNADITQEFNQLNVIDPDEAAKFMSFRTSYIGALGAQSKQVEDEHTKASLFLEGSRGTLTESQAINAFQNGDIDSDTVKYLLTDLIPKSKAGKSYLTNPVVTSGTSGLRKIIGGNEESASYNGTLVGRFDA